MSEQRPSVERTVGWVPAHEDPPSETDEFDINEDFECCIHGVGWDEDCPDCNDYEDEADGLK